MSTSWVIVVLGFSWKRLDNMRCHTYIGNATDVGPKRGRSTAKDADVRRYVGFNDISCATSDVPYLLLSWRTRRRHLIELFEFEVRVFA